MLKFLKDLGVSPFVAGLASAIIYSYKKWKERQENILNATKEQLDSISDLVTNTEKLKNAFLVEQVFQYKFKKYIPATVIYALLKMKNPTLGINNYLYAGRYLDFDRGNGKLFYKGDMMNSAYRNKLKIRYYVGYAVFGFFGLMLLFNANLIIKNMGFEWFVLSIPFIFYFLMIAVEFITSALRINAAEDLVDTFNCRERQNKE